MVQTDVVHPFWGVRRQTKHDDEWNVELAWHDITTVVAAEFGAKGDKTSPVTDTVTVSLPCMVNSKAIDVGKDVILKCAVPDQLKAKPAKRDKTWVDTARQEERKRTKKTNPR